jgi:hypothetical protein
VLDGLYLCSAWSTAALSGKKAIGDVEVALLLNIPKQACKKARPTRHG